MIFYFLFLRVWVWHLNYYNSLHYFNFLIFLIAYVWYLFLYPYQFICLFTHLFIYSLIPWIDILDFCGYVIWFSILFYSISNYMISYFNFIFNFEWDLEPSRRWDHDQIGNLMKRRSSVDDHLTMIRASRVFYRIPVTFPRCPKKRHYMAT